MGSCTGEGKSRGGRQEIRGSRRNPPGSDKRGLWGAGWTGGAFRRQRSEPGTAGRGGRRTFGLGQGFCKMLTRGGLTAGNVDSKWKKDAGADTLIWSSAASIYPRRAPGTAQVPQNQPSARPVSPGPTRSSLCRWLGLQLQAVIPAPWGLFPRTQVHCDGRSTRKDQMASS